MDPSFQNPTDAPQPLPMHQVNLFSERDFMSGGFVGGPLAPTYFFYKNFKNQGNPHAAKLSIVYGIAIFAAIVGLAMLIESVFHLTLPRWVYPPVLLGVTKGLYAKFQAAQVKQHKDHGGQFYKSRAAGVVLISILVTLLVFVGYIQLVITTTHSDLGIWDTIGLSQDYDRTTYQTNMKQITQNDQDSIKIFDLPTTTSNAEIITTLDAGIARYNKNLELINQIDNIKKLPNIIKQDDVRLRQYTELRIQMFELFKKATIEDNINAYEPQLKALNQQIEPLTKKQ